MSIYQIIILRALNYAYVVQHILSLLHYFELYIFLILNDLLFLYATYYNIFSIITPSLSFLSYECYQSLYIAFSISAPCLVSFMCTQTKCLSYSMWSIPGGEEDHKHTTGIPRGGFEGA